MIGIVIMDEYTVYKYLELLIIPLYLILIFLFVQIWFLWKNVDKNELILRSFVNEHFFKKNCLYVFFFSIFFMIHEILEGTNLPEKAVIFEFFEMLSLVFLVLFAHGWHNVLRTCVYKKDLPVELTNPSEAENCLL